MIKGVLLGLAVALIIAAGGGYFIITSGMIPANADGQPGAFELWAANASLEATLKREAPGIANPIAATPENFEKGLRLYAQDCAICHGGGQGADSNASPIAKGEYPAPPQLASDGVEDDPQGWSFWKIKHGIRLTGMPSWKNALDDNQIWTLALFLKHMDKLPAPIDKEWKSLKTPDLAALAEVSAPTPSPSPAQTKP
jgi:thiosulfate dehydrogenase